MAVLAQPSVLYPKNVISNADMLDFLDDLHPESLHKDKAFSMINNSTIEKRHMILSLDEILALKDFGQRGKIYEAHARTMALTAAKAAIKNALLSTDDISMVLVTSCTGFMMPSLTACLINDLQLPATTVQLPIAQMGCVAGAAAINRATEHCKCGKHNNALIVTLETSSLCFHRDADRLQDFITDSLFGDAAAAVVMRGDNDCHGLKITHNQSHFMANTEDYIKYQLTGCGFKFSLDKDVMHSIEKVAPHLINFIEQNTQLSANELDFYVFHTGGRRIQDEVARCLKLADNQLQHSRNCLRESGNTSSVAVIDVFSRQFSERKANDKGVIAAFGPGFTTEMALGYWQ